MQNLVLGKSGYKGVVIYDLDSIKDGVFKIHCGGDDGQGQDGISGCDSDLYLGLIKTYGFDPIRAYLSFFSKTQLTEFEDRYFRFYKAGKGFLSRFICDVDPSLSISDFEGKNLDESKVFKLFEGQYQFVRVNDTIFVFKTKILN